MNLLLQKLDIINNTPNALDNIFPMFSGFVSQYLPHEVKYESIKLVQLNEMMAIVRMEYFTNVKELTEDLQFDKNNFAYYTNTFQDTKVCFYI